MARGRRRREAVLESARTREVRSMMLAWERWAEEDERRRKEDERRREEEVRRRQEDEVRRVEDERRKEEEAQWPRGTRGGWRC